MTQKTEPAQQQANDNDMVLVERSLIGAACNAIEKKRDAPNLLAKLRAVTMAAGRADAVPASAVRKLVIAARTSGGTAGRDEGLCAAVWQYRQVAAPNGWHDTDDEQDAARMKNDGYEVRKLYTGPQS